MHRLRGSHAETHILGEHVLLVDPGLDHVTFTFSVHTYCNAAVVRSASQSYDLLIKHTHRHHTLLDCFFLCRLPLSLSFRRA